MLPPGDDDPILPCAPFSMPSSIPVRVQWSRTATGTGDHPDEGAVTAEEDVAGDGTHLVRAREEVACFVNECTLAPRYTRESR